MAASQPVADQQGTSNVRSGRSVVAGFGIFLSAAVTSGLGLFAGAAAGSRDGLAGTAVVFGLLGMVVVSLAAAWLLRGDTRKHHLAALPLCWLLIGGPHVALRVTSANVGIAIAVSQAIAIPLGLTLNELLAQRLGIRDGPAKQPAETD